MIAAFDIFLQIATFAIVFAGVLMLQRAVGAYLAVRRRLGAAPREIVLGPGSVMKSEGITNRALLWVQSATSLSDSKESSKLRRELALAGFDHPSAPVWYVIIRFSLAIGLPILLIVGTSLSGHPMGALGSLLFPLLLCGLALIAPRRVVEHRANARRVQMAQEFPDTLDLLVVCVEAGLGLESAFVRVGQEVRESHPRVAEEFSRLAEELSAGRGRADALRAMSDRVDVDSVRSFVALLIQTDALGVSIAQSLRTYSTEMREHRFLTAEEKAMRIPVLMTVPLVACLLPVIIVALLLPPAIDVVRTLAPAMAAKPAQAPVR